MKGKIKVDRNEKYNEKLISFPAIVYTQCDLLLYNRMSFKIRDKKFP